LGGDGLGGFVLGEPGQDAGGDADEGHGYEQAARGALFDVFVVQDRFRHPFLPVFSVVCGDVSTFVRDWRKNPAFRAAIRAKALFFFNKPVYLWTCFYSEILIFLL
jgi:hypothetical protein